MARKPINYNNGAVVEKLAHFSTWPEAAMEYRCLDDILAGTCNLDHGGNDRPISMATLFSLLASLPVLSTDAVIEATGYSRSYSSKIRRALQIASSQFEAQMAIRAAKATNLRDGAVDSASLTAARQPPAQRKGLREPDVTLPEVKHCPPDPRQALVDALAKCHREHGRTLYTALRAYGGDIGAVLMKVVGPGDSTDLVEAGVLTVEHDVDVCVRPGAYEPPRLKRHTDEQEDRWLTRRHKARS